MRKGTTQSRSVTDRTLTPLPMVATLSRFSGEGGRGQPNLVRVGRVSQAPVSSRLSLTTRSVTSSWKPSGCIMFGFPGFGR